LKTELDQDTLNIDYRNCDAVETPWPSGGHGTASRRRGGRRARAWYGRARRAARRAVLAVSARWESIWPPLLGVLLGTSTAVAVWLMALLWWLNR
jgi:hypothetical protein